MFHQNELYGGILEASNSIPRRPRRLPDRYRKSTVLATPEEFGRPASASISSETFRRWRALSMMSWTAACESVRRLSRRNSARHFGTFNSARFVPVSSFSPSRTLPAELRSGLPHDGSFAQWLIVPLKNESC